MDIFSTIFWWLSISHLYHPLGVSRCQRCLIHHFFTVREVGNSWTWLQNSDPSFSRYLWVEADVWDGGRLIERLVPESAGLVKVAPQLGESKRGDYCSFIVLNWCRISIKNPPNLFSYSFPSSLKSFNMLTTFVHLWVNTVKFCFWQKGAHFWPLKEIICKIVLHINSLGFVDGLQFMREAVWWCLLPKQDVMH